MIVAGPAQIIDGAVLIENAKMAKMAVEIDIVELEHLFRILGRNVVMIENVISALRRIINELSHVNGVCRIAIDESIKTITLFEFFTGVQRIAFSGPRI